MSKVIIGIALVAVLALGSFFLIRRTSPQEVADSTSGTNLAENAALAGLDRDAPIICEYSDAEFQTTAYILQESARVNGISESENTASIIKGNTTWHWDPATKEGFTLTLSSESQEKAAEVAQEFLSQKDLPEKLDSQEADCRNENFDTSLLEVPTDVTFQDMSGMMNELDQMGESIPDNTGDQIPEEYRQYLPQ